MNGMGSRERAALDSWLTREGPGWSMDPHAPFSAIPGDLGTWWVVDDREGEEAPPQIVFHDHSDGEQLAQAAAEAFAAARNRQEGRPPNADGSCGVCTACGDFHGDPCTCGAPRVEPGRTRALLGGTGQHAPDCAAVQ